MVVNFSGLSRSLVVAQESPFLLREGSGVVGLVFLRVHALALSPLSLLGDLIRGGSTLSGI